MSSLSNPNGKNAAKRAGVYIRVSTDEQEDNGSLSDQLKACEHLADQRGWRVTAVYQDIESGANPERPQFHAMVDAIRRRELDALICWKRDRLGRDMDAIGYVRFEAKRAGVEIALVINPRGTSYEDRLLDTIEDAGSEKERIDIALRTQAGTRRRTFDERLYLPGPRAPYGYQWDDPYKPLVTMPGQKARAKTRLSIDPVSGQVVRRIFDQLASGKSARSIERELTAEKVPTPTEYAKGLAASKPWAVSTIRALIRNPVYKGSPMAYRGTAKRKGITSVPVPLPPITEPVALPAGIAEPLASTEVWQRANDQLDRNQQECTRRNQHPEETLLRAGYAVCGYCHSPLVVNRRRDQPSYRCAGYNQQIHGCPCFRIAAHILDKAVWDKVTEVITDPSYVRQYMQQWLEGQDTTAEQLERVEAELVAIKVKEERLVPQLVRLDDPTPVHKVLNDLSARKRVLMLEHNNLKMRRDSYKSTLERWDAMLARWQWQGSVDHPKLTNMGYADQRFWLANLNVKAEVWQKEGGPEGQQYRITMAIDESFWLPSEDELTGAWASDHAELQTTRPAKYYTSLEHFVSTSARRSFAVPSGRC